MKRTIDSGVLASFQRANTVALICHVSPDGDTVGSALALRLALLSLGKAVRAFCQDKVPDTFTLLPGADAVENEASLAPSDRFDLCCSVDVSTAARMGRCAAAMEHADSRAIIDHHGTNPRDWAPVSDVDGNAPACALLVYALIRQLGVSVDPDMAACLYTALSTDTGNFSYSSTSAEAFEVQAELMKTGFDMSELNRRLFRVKALPHVLLVKCALESLTLYAGGRVTATSVTLADMEACHALPEHTDEIVNQGLQIEGVCMTVFGRESADGSVKLSLRGNPGYPVDQIAAAFGGGGHALAAGITFRSGTLRECMDRVIAAMLSHFNA